MWFAQLQSFMGDGAVQRFLNNHKPNPERNVLPREIEAITWDLLGLENNQQWFMVPEI